MNLDEAADIAVELVSRWEGFRASPYLCPAGIPTILFGVTRYPDGRRVTLNDPPMSREDGERILHQLVSAKYMPAVVSLCPGADTPGRIAALTSFTYNLGTSRLKASTLRRRVNAGEWDLVPAEFRKWIRGGGKILRGLVLRREAEIGYL